MCASFWKCFHLWNIFFTYLECNNKLELKSYAVLKLREKSCVRNSLLQLLLLLLSLILKMLCNCKWKFSIIKHSHRIGNSCSCNCALKICSNIPNSKNASSATSVLSTIIDNALSTMNSQCTTIESIIWSLNANMIFSNLYLLDSS